MTLDDKELFVKKRNNLVFYVTHVCFELKSSLWLDFHLSAGSCPNIIPVYHFLDPGQMEDSDLNNRLIRRHGIPRVADTDVISVHVSSWFRALHIVWTAVRWFSSSRPAGFGLGEYDETGTSSEWLTR